MRSRTACRRTSLSIRRSVLASSATVDVSGTCGSTGRRTLGKVICARAAGTSIINTMHTRALMEANLVEHAPRGKKPASRIVLET